MSNSITGKWRILEMEQWDKEFVDFVGPGFIAFQKRGTGEMHFGAVDLQLDWRLDGGSGRANFTFEGFDEGDEVSGQGWAKTKDNQLIGHIAFHFGDESGFKATRGKP